MKGRIASCFAAAAALLFTAPAQAQDLMARDQMFEIANEHLKLYWYLSANNIYSGVPNATCPYTTPGWQTGLSYKWGGYDTRDGFYQAVVINGGMAGDTNSAAVVSGTYGNDCSGYLSRVWRSGRWATSGAHNYSAEVTYATIAPGDIMNYAGSHVRMFERYTGTNLTMQLECTTGVSPGRVVRRVLSTNSNYIPRRYNNVVPWPSLTRAAFTTAGTVTLDFLGHASTGFRVYHSIDQANWTLKVGEGTLGILAQSATVTGLADGTTHYFKVAALNGATESPASIVLAARRSPGAPTGLIVNGYDRWIRKTESGGGLPHGFVPRLATALATNGFSFDSVDNVRVVDATTALGGYQSVWWILGDESTTDEAFSYQEQQRIQSYLESGGRLLVSGAEILWDLDNKAGPLNDAAFAQNYLKADFASDGANGNGFGFSGIAGTPFSGCSGSFDDGTGGTFRVTYPDVLTPVGGANAIMNYANGGNAGIAYRGIFGSSTTPGAVVLVGFPLETVTTPAVRAALVQAAASQLFAAARIDDYSQFQHDPSN